MRLYTTEELESMDIEKAEQYYKRLHAESRKIL
jgi:hypothetical protein